MCGRRHGSIQFLEAIPLRLGPNPQWPNKEAAAYRNACRLIAEAKDGSCSPAVAFAAFKAAAIDQRLLQTAKTESGARHGGQRAINHRDDEPPSPSIKYGPTHGISLGRATMGSHRTGAGVMRARPSLAGPRPAANTHSLPFYQQAPKFQVPLMYKKPVNGAWLIAA
ncbi:DUF982 domain-containing protein [Mesorhizobium sp. C268A]